MSLAQLTDSKQAKILKEQRFNAGDGRFGSAFAAEDGTVFREETGADGERIGQYSYIGEDGDIITVKYSAGRGGFRILEGNHVPEGASGQNSAAAIENLSNNSINNSSHNNNNNSINNHNNNINNNINSINNNINNLNNNSMLNSSITMPLRLPELTSTPSLTLMIQAIET